MAKHTFTKTEQELLAEAEASPRKQVCVDHGYQARRSFGSRRQDAAKKLLQKGLLVRIHTDGGTPLYKNGYGINGIHYSGLWKLAAHLTPEEAQQIIDKGGN